MVNGSFEPAGFTGRDVTFLAADGANVWAVVDGSEIWRADGDAWNHAADLRELRATCIATTDHDTFVGSSEAHLFRLDGGSLETVPSFDGAEGRGSWYTPWGGPPDTRSLSEWDESVYVNVHVGGILRTDDRGASWQPTIDIDTDVHQVTTSEGMVLAACAGSLAISRDGGSTWTVRNDGLDAAYARAVTVCDGDVLISASSGPRGGRTVSTGPHSPAERSNGAAMGFPSGSTTTSTATASMRCATATSSPPARETDACSSRRTVVRRGSWQCPTCLRSGVCWFSPDRGCPPDHRSHD
jgi:hypothetical protein